MSTCFSRITRSCVSVPVLSVHSTSIAPKFWIEFRRLTISRARAIASAPLARLIVTIIGSISGARPTATETANRKACSQSPLVRPLTMNTSGTITSMKRSTSQMKRLMPWSKAVGTRARVSVPAMAPKRVARPVASTTPVALPLTTLLPMKHTLGSASAAASAGVACANFSTGSDSPVSAASLTNRSLASSRRRSAGIMSPADSLTTSPGTTRASAISTCAAPGGCASRRLSVPAAAGPARGTAPGAFGRSTVAVVCTIARSFSAALPERTSCTNDSSTDSSTMMPITTAPPGSPVRSVRTASPSSSSGSGEKTSSASRLSGATAMSVTTSLGPTRSRRARACGSDRPAADESMRASAAAGDSAATSCSSASAGLAGAAGTEGRRSPKAVRR